MTHPALATMVEAAEAGDVLREQAIQFLEGACRNWSKVPRLSEGDISDVATELTRFSSRRSATANILSLAQYVKGLEEKAAALLEEVTYLSGKYPLEPSLSGLEVAASDLRVALGGEP